MDNEQIKNKFNKIEDRGMTFYLVKTDFFDEPKVLTPKEQCENLIDWYSNQLVKEGRDREDVYGWRWTREEIIQLMIMYANKKLDET